MLKQMPRIILSLAFACSVSLRAATQQAPTSSSSESTTAATKHTKHHHNRFVGDIERVDKDTETVVVKAADGTEHVFKYTGETSVHGIEGAAKATDLETKKGEHVVVHYTVTGTDKTAESIDHAAKDIAGDSKPSSK